ncbi:hypothetical protein BGZ65_002703, partial [Modicella reniformis]
MKPYPRLFIQGLLGVMCLLAAILQGSQIWNTNNGRSALSVAVVASYVAAFAWIFWCGGWYYKTVYQVGKRGSDDKEAQGGVGVGVGPDGTSGGQGYKPAMIQSRSSSGQIDREQTEVMIPIPGETRENTVNLSQVNATAVTTGAVVGMDDDDPRRKSQHTVQQQQQQPSQTQVQSSYPQHLENAQKRSVLDITTSALSTTEDLDDGNNNDNNNNVSSSFGLGIDICTKNFMDDVKQEFNKSENNGDSPTTTTTGISSNNNNTGNFQNMSPKSTSPGSTVSKSLVRADAAAAVRNTTTITRNHPHNANSMNATTDGRSHSNSTRIQSIIANSSSSNSINSINGISSNTNNNNNNQNNNPRLRDHAKIFPKAHSRSHSSIHDIYSCRNTPLLPSSSREFMPESTTSLSLNRMQLYASTTLFSPTISTTPPPPTTTPLTRGRVGYLGADTMKAFNNATTSSRSSISPGHITAFINNRHAEPAVTVTTTAAAAAVAASPSVQNSSTVRPTEEKEEKEEVMVLVGTPCSLRSHQSIPSDSSNHYPFFMTPAEAEAAEQNMDEHLKAIRR